MKYCTFFVVGVLLLSSTAFGELSVKDLEKFHGMFKESEARMREFMKESEERTKEYVSQEIALVNLRIDEMNKRIETETQAANIRHDSVNNRFNDVNRFLSFIFGLLGALIVAVIGMPLWERKKAREQDEQLKAQQRQLEVQQRQLEAQQQQIEAQQRQLETQQAELDAVREALAVLEQR